LKIRTDEEIRSFWPVLQKFVKRQNSDGAMHQAMKSGPCSYLLVLEGLIEEGREVSLGTTPAENEKTIFPGPAYGVLRSLDDHLKVYSATYGSPIRLTIEGKQVKDKKVKDIYVGESELRWQFNRGYVTHNAA